MTVGLIIAGQLPVLVTTLITFVLTAILAGYLTKSYLKNRMHNYLFWTLGMWTFAIGVLLEIVFAAGIYTTPLIDLYLFIIVILVEFLAIGSVSMAKTKWIKNAYYAYTIAVTVFTAYSVLATSPGNLLLEYVVAGAPSTLVIVASSLATFPAAVALVVMAVKGYLKTKSMKLMSIILGVIIVSVAGTLYIVSFPAFLYIAEFVGIVLLWFGFFTMKR